MASRCGGRWRNRGLEREDVHVTEELLPRTAFPDLAEDYRAELLLHCYRIVGSVQDAEDLVQETLVAAWRSADRFEGRSSLRTWLYRIATNRCLNALRDRERRPQEVAPPPGTPEPPPPTRLSEPLWLEPYPDALLEGVETREAIGLAYISAVQRLTPRQRAVLVLRDVLGFRAREVADMLDVSTVSVNRALLRARRAIEQTSGPGDREHHRLTRPRSGRWQSASPPRLHPGTSPASSPSSAATRC